jgi:hypothetical protein
MSFALNFPSFCTHKRRKKGDCGEYKIQLKKREEEKKNEKKRKQQGGKEKKR